MSQWVRLWEDMPNDPKWRVVAKRSRRPVSEVLAVFVHMMTNAGASAERGCLDGWSDEDVAISIDAEVEHVTAIREAMNGKTLDGDHLTGWEKRQPKREDGSAERAKNWREHQKTEKLKSERKRTQANAPEEKRLDQNISELRSGDESPADGLDEDPKAVLFSDGLKWLAKKQGKSENQLRPLVGQMLRDVGGDAYAAQLLGIFRDVKREGKADPVSWIKGVIRARGGARAGPASVDGIEEARRMLRERNGTDRDKADEDRAGFAKSGDVRPLEVFDEQDGNRGKPMLDLVAVRSH
jgi:hypothetical protein